MKDTENEVQKEGYAEEDGVILGAMADLQNKDLFANQPLHIGLHLPDYV